MAKKSKGRTKKTKRKTPAKSQATRFKEAARSLGAEKGGQFFAAAFDRIVRPKVGR